MNKQLIECVPNISRGEIALRIIRTCKEMNIKTEAKTKSFKTLQSGTKYRGHGLGIFLFLVWGKRKWFKLII